MCCGDRERIKSRECSPEEGTNTFPRAEKHTLLALFPLFRSLTKREKGEEKKGREKRAFFHLFFLRFFFKANCSLFFLSLPLFSLFSLSRAAFVCVFLLEFSPHKI